MHEATCPHPQSEQMSGSDRPLSWALKRLGVRWRSRQTTLACVAQRGAAHCPGPGLGVLLPGSLLLGPRSVGKLRSVKTPEGTGGKQRAAGHVAACAEPPEVDPTERLSDL